MTTAECWRIENDSAAEWAVHQIIDLQADTEKWRRHYARLMEDVESRNAEKIARRTAQLEEYFQTVPHRETKTTESYALPSARLVRKAQQPLYHRDDEELLRWLETSAPELVRAKWEPDWAELKKHIVVAGGEAVFVDTGEIIKGVRVEERGRKFTVALTGPEEE